MTEQEHKKYKVWEPLAFAIVAVIGMIAGTQLVAPHSGDGIKIGTRSAKAERVTEMIRFIEEKYVDEVDSDRLVQKAIESILGELDPHSSYISPGELVNLNEKMDGHFEGIGIEFHVMLDTVMVLSVMDGGPADKAGIKELDRVIKSNDSLLVGIELTDEVIAHQLKGVKGTQLSLLVLRPGVDTLIPFDLVRDEIPIHSVDAAYMLDDDTGYFKLSRFSSTTYKEFMQHVETMIEEEGMKHVVIDLRQNPGGYLKEAVNILSQLFAEKGKLLVYTEGDHTKRMEYKSTGKPFYEIGNVAVLIDGGSASASEIVAGAIQDHDRGVVIGTRSYGKGLVQEQYMLRNGGALRLTTARYYTASGRSIQRPYALGNSVASDSAAVDTVAYLTDGGRQVFGGGGVNPDIVVENRFDWYDKDIQSIYQWMLQYAIYGFSALHPTDVETVENFLEVFPSNGTVHAHFMQFWEDRNDEDFDPAVADEYWEQSYAILRAMLASHHFGHEGWYRMMHIDDPVVRKAMEAIKEDTRTTLKM